MTQFDPLPEGFVWRAVEPQTLIPVQLYWRRGAGAAVRRFVDVAVEVSAADGWLSPGRSAVSSPPGPTAVGVPEQVD